MRQVVEKGGFFDHPVAPTPPSSAASPVPDGGPVDRVDVEWLVLGQLIMPLSAGTRLGHYDVRH